MLGIGVQSSTFGLNAENPDFERGRTQVWDGRLERTYQATYLECDSNVTTDEAVYRSKLREVQEWPLGWPTNTSPKS
jgi:hypothetical protein